MISINNGVTNVLGSPAMISDQLINRPDAQSVAVGTIFIDITDDSGAMYQSNGTSWYSLGGGTGTIYGIDSVLAQNQYLTDNREINTDGYFLWVKDNSDYLLSVVRNNVQLSTWNESYASIRVNTGSITRTINTYFQTATGIQSVGLNMYTQDTIDGVICDFGDYSNSNFGTKLSIDDNLQTIVTENPSGIKGLFIDMNNLNYQFGDEQCFLQVNTDSTTIQTYTNGSKNGLNIYGFKSYQLGDYNDNNNGTWFGLNDETQDLRASSNLLTTSSGSTSGQYIKIKIGGDDYVIALINA